MFGLMQNAALQELHFCRHDDFKAVVALHNLKLGPALGGCRFIEYHNEHDAVADAIRLAKGMSYKAALAKVPQGGGKAVIIKPKGDFDREKLFHYFAQFINDLGGRYITAMDSGTQVEDMDCIRQVCPYVASTSDIGDPSPSTADGVALGIRTAVNHKLGRGLEGVRVAIQGLGHVGHALVKDLSEAGAKLWVTDIDPQKVQAVVNEYKATAVEPEDIYRQEVDVFSPCGLGAILNEETIEQLNCAIVAGCANNQLKEDKLGDVLHEKNILYAPDYVINSGGLIYASSKYRGLDQSEIDHAIHKLKDTLDKIFMLSSSKNQPTNRIANEMAEQVLYG